MGLALLLGGLIVVGIVSGPNDPAPTTMDLWAERAATLAAEAEAAKESDAATKRASESDVSYADLDEAVGCKSTYSSDKKHDIIARYKDRWITWSGTVVQASASDASLNIDGVGLPDLQVDFADKRAGYNLERGDRITVRFLMKTAGGCFLPYSGTMATIVK